MVSAVWLALLAVVCTANVAAHAHQWEPKTAEDMLKVVESEESGPWIKERYRKKLGMELPDGTIVQKAKPNTTVVLKEKKVVSVAATAAPKCTMKDSGSKCADKLLLCSSSEFGAVTAKECPVTCAVGDCGTKRVEPSCKARSMNGVMKITGGVDTGTGLVAKTALSGDAGTLVSKAAWVPKSSARDVFSYLETEFPAPELVVGVSIQGEYDPELENTGKMSKESGWVKQYKMQYWDLTTSKWADVVGKGGPLIFPGTVDPDTAVHSNFYKPINTTKLKFLPISQHSRASMRIGVQVCDPRVMPKPAVVPRKKKKPIKNATPAEKAAALAAAKEGVEKQKMKAATEAKNAETAAWVSQQINQVGAKSLKVTPEEVANATGLVLPKTAASKKKASKSPK